MSPSLYFLLWKILSPSLHVVIVDGYSVKSCNLGVPLGGDELGVFQPHHLGCTRTALLLS